MIVIVEGLYKDVVESFVIKNSRLLNLPFINCEKYKTFEDYIKLLIEQPIGIYYNTWINSNLSQDEKFVLNTLVKNNNGFAYYITSKNSDKLIAEFDKETLRKIDYNMVMLKLSIPIIAKDVDELNIEP